MGAAPVVSGHREPLAKSITLGQRRSGCRNNLSCRHTVGRRSNEAGPPVGAQQVCQGSQLDRVGGRRDRAVEQRTGHVWLLGAYVHSHPFAELAVGLQGERDPGAGEPDPARRREAGDPAQGRRQLIGPQRAQRVCCQSDDASPDRLGQHHRDSGGGLDHVRTRRVTAAGIRRHLVPPAAA